MQKHAVDGGPRVASVRPAGDDVTAVALGQRPTPRRRYPHLLSAARPDLPVVGPADGLLKGHLA